MVFAISQLKLQRFLGNFTTDMNSEHFLVEINDRKLRKRTVNIWAAGKLLVLATSASLISVIISNSFFQFKSCKYQQLTGRQNRI